MTIFPFTVYAKDTGHYIQQPFNSHSTFCKYKPRDLSWYAYDIEVLSQSRAKFTVYDMECFARGGIGDVVAEFECDVDAADVEKMIKNKVRKVAREMEDIEFEATRMKRVMEIEDKLMEALK